MQRETDSQAQVAIGPAGAVIHYPRRRHPRVAGVLGREVDAQSGTETVWLDAFVHEVNGEVLGEWVATGAVSTVLTRQCRPASPGTA